MGLACTRAHTHEHVMKPLKESTAGLSYAVLHMHICIRYEPCGKCAALAAVCAQACSHSQLSQNNQWIPYLLAIALKEEVRWQVTHPWLALWWPATAGPASVRPPPAAEAPGG